MTVQLSKAQIDALTAELSAYGLKVTRARKPSAAETEKARKARFRNWGWKGHPADKVLGVTAAWHVMTWYSWRKRGAVYPCRSPWPRDIFEHWSETWQGHLRRMTPPCPLLTYQPAQREFLNVLD